MQLEELLSMYIEKYGEKYDINTVLLSDETKEQLTNMLKQSICIFYLKWVEGLFYKHIYSLIYSELKT